MYRPVLEWALELPWLVVIAGLAALVGSLSLMPRLDTEFLPVLNEETLWLAADLPPGISLTEARNQGKKIRALVKQFDEVTTVMCQIVRPEDGTDPHPLNTFAMFVGLKPESEWRRKLSREALVEKIEKAVVR